MRLFISINVPPELHRYCRQLQSQFPDMKNTDEFHMTIQFLGDDIQDAQPIIKVLRLITFDPFEIEMGDALPFGPPQEPRGVWIECKMSPSLQKLADAIRSAMEGIGYLADKPFRAHITLGRYRRAPRQKAEKIKGEPRHFKVEHFHLMESRLTPRGPLHKSLARFPE